MDNFSKFETHLANLVAKLRCCVCSVEVRNLYNSPCGHVFCQKDFDKLPSESRKGPRKCSICCQEYSLGRFKADKLLEQQALAVNALKAVFERERKLCLQGKKIAESKRPDLTEAQEGVSKKERGELRLLDKNEYGESRDSNKNGREEARVLDRKGRQFESRNMNKKERKESGDLDNKGRKESKDLDKQGRKETRDLDKKEREDLVKKERKESKDLVKKERKESEDLDKKGRKESEDLDKNGRKESKEKKELGNTSKRKSLGGSLPKPQLIKPLMEGNKNAKVDKPNVKRNDPPCRNLVEVSSPRTRLIRTNVRSVENDKSKLDEETVKKDGKNTRQQQSRETKEEPINRMTPRRQKDNSTEKSNVEDLKPNVDNLEKEQKAPGEDEKEVINPFKRSVSSKRKLEEQSDTEKVPEKKSLHQPSLGLSMRQSRRSVVRNDQKEVGHSETLDSKVKSDSENRFSPRPKPPKISKSSKNQPNSSQDTDKVEKKTPENHKTSKSPANVDLDVAAKVIQVEQISKVEPVGAKTKISKVEPVEAKTNENVQPENTPKQHQSKVPFFGLFKFASPKPSQVVKPPAPRSKPASFLKMGHLKPEIYPESPTKEDQFFHYSEHLGSSSVSLLASNDDENKTQHLGSRIDFIPTTQASQTNALKRRISQMTPVKKFKNGDDLETVPESESDSESNDSTDAKVSNHQNIETCENEDEDLFLESTPQKTPWRPVEAPPKSSPLKEVIYNSSPPITFTSTMELQEETESFDSCRFLSTGLNLSKRSRLAEFHQKFGTLSANILNDTVTHLITEVDEQNRSLRTLKFIQAMSKMKIIVGFPWVEECFRVGKLVSIENFIPLYTTGEPGPRRVYDIVQSGKERLLFQKFGIILHGMFGKEVPKHEIEAVLNNCGAKVFRNLTDLAANRGWVRLIVVDTISSGPETRRMFVTNKVAVISKDWVLDSVGSFELKSIANYVTGDIKKKELIEAGYAV